MSEQVYRNALQEFTPLPLDGKKSALLELIGSFWTLHPVFWELTQDIQTSIYTDEQYIDIYKIVLKSMYEVEQEWLDAWVKRIEKLHDFLMQLKAKEAEENKKQGDIDVRLDKVLTTLQ
jgi:hypothetical protein